MLMSAIICLFVNKTQMLVGGNIIDKHRNVGIMPSQASISQAADWEGIVTVNNN